MIGIIGKKIGMTRIFADKGIMIPVTVIEAGPCPVVQVKTEDRDGYSAVQLGFEPRRKKLITQPMLGVFKKAGVEPQTILREFRDWDGKAPKEGDQVTVSLFKIGEKVSVTGTSKGKGFTGVVKRYNFRGGPKTHGQSDRWRAPGSIGASSYPSRVWKGMRMAGHKGNVRKTVSNLEIVKVDEKHNYLYIKGAVPGPNNGYVTVYKKG